MNRMALALPPCILLLAGVTYVKAEVAVMPWELVQYAENNGCHQVDDFFVAHKDMVDPPYVYGYLPGKKQDSAVFWCQTDDGGRRRFWLLVMDNIGRKASESCDKKVEVTGAYPGGLSLARRGFITGVTTLDDFNYVEDVKRKIQRGVKITGPIIVSDHGGTKVLFYCYRGAWVFQGID